MAAARNHPSLVPSQNVTGLSSILWPEASILFKKKCINTFNLPLLAYSDMCVCVCVCVCRLVVIFFLWAGGNAG